MAHEHGKVLKKPIAEDKVVSIAQDETNARVRLAETYLLDSFQKVSIDKGYDLVAYLNARLENRNSDPISRLEKNVLSKVLSLTLKGLDKLEKSAFTRAKRDRRNEARRVEKTVSNERRERFQRFLREILINSMAQK